MKPTPPLFILQLREQLDREAEEIRARTRAETEAEFHPDTLKAELDAWNALYDFAEELDLEKRRQLRTRNAGGPEGRAM